MFVCCVYSFRLFILADLLQKKEDLYFMILDLKDKQHILAIHSFLHQVRDFSKDGCSFFLSWSKETNF